MRMCSLAMSKLLLENGIEPVMQISCRDRNKIALQSDILGANALGIRNILCITGDSVKAFTESPVMHKMFLIPKAFAPRMSDCKAILLRSLQDICITGSIPFSSNSLDIAKLHILITALLPSVMLTACC